MATTYETLSRRAPFLEAAQEKYVDLLTQQVGRAPGTAGVPTLSELGPQIAGQNVLTQQAQQAAATQAGLGQLSFGPEGQLHGSRHRHRCCWLSTILRSSSSLFRTTSFPSFYVSVSTTSFRYNISRV